MTNRLLHAAALLGALLLTGCGYPDLSLWVHSNRLVEPARAAAERIEAATGLVIGINESMSGSTPVFESDTLNAETDGLNGLTDYEGSGAKEGIRFIVIERSMQLGDALETLLMHEFIHSLGVDHLSDPDALMNGGNHTNYRLTVMDVREICKVRRCTRSVPEI